MNEKQKKRLAAIQRQQALVDAAKNGRRELTAEEQAEFGTLQREIERLKELSRETNPYLDHMRSLEEEIIRIRSKITEPNGI